MKKSTKVLGAALVLAAATTANVNAQSFVNSDVKNYSRFNFSLTMAEPNASITMGDLKVENEKGKDKNMMWGASVGYLYGANITGHKVPLFLEVGPELNFATRKTDLKSDGDVWTNMLSVGMPVNIAYKFRVADNISISPYAGVTPRVNLLYTMSHDGEKISAFDKTDMDGHTAERFQLGLNLGVGAYFKNFYVGYRYQGDLTDFINVKEDGAKAKMNFNTHYVTVGIKF